MTVAGRWAFLKETLDAEAFAEQCHAAHRKWPDVIEHALHYAEALGILGRVDEKLATLRGLLDSEPTHQQVNTA